MEGGKKAAGDKANLAPDRQRGRAEPSSPVGRVKWVGDGLCRKSGAVSRAPNGTAGAAFRLRPGRVRAPPIRPTGHPEAIYRFTPTAASYPFPSVNEGEITLILQQIEQGDAQAANRLLPLVYDELRQLAAAKMARESAGQTLQSTALVHEVWLRLGGDAQQPWKNRAHFFAAASEAMRRILIENARRKRAARHGGGLARVDASATGFDLAAPVQDDDELLLLNDALDALAAHDPRKAELVKQRYFVGLSLEEAAQVLDISDRTAKRDWAYARAWLHGEMERQRA